MDTSETLEKFLRSILEEQRSERWVKKKMSEVVSANEQVKKEIVARKLVEEYLHQLVKVVNIIPIGVIITDLEGEIIYTNSTEAEMHGYQVEELLGQNVRIFTPPELRRPLSLNQITAWKGLIRECINIKKDGTIFPAGLMSEIVKSEEGEPFAIVTSCEDITERRQTEEELARHRHHIEEIVADRTTELTTTNEQLRQAIIDHKRTAEALRKSEERYRIVLETIPDLVVVYNMNEKVAYMNPAFSKVFGWTLSESRGWDIDTIPTAVLPDVREILTTIKHGETVSGIEASLLTKGGSRIQVSISGAGFFESSGKLQGYVITLQDITERRKTEGEIRFLAYHDVLTGLPNRKSFYIRLEDKLPQTHIQGQEKRKSAQNSWAILFLDLDRFKNVNDTLGHDVGDELLQLVAARLQLCVRKSDYIFRFGGDEFTVIVNDLSHDTDVVKVAQKIREDISRPYFLRDQELYLTVSIGISLYPMDGQDAETLVKRADMAMYTAKEEKHGYRIFTEEMNKKALERMSLESKLHSALQQDQFVVYYQPVADNSDRIIGMEALLRWFHPELGIISPSKFIPLAEETGAIVSIGKWVLREACQQVKNWHQKGHDKVCVAVNLSTRQFKEPDLIETVEQALEETGLAPNYLKLEVTESGFMEDPKRAISQMEHLRAQGIHFSIDDFGMGYSSLSCLKRLPIDTLKIDRSFVMDSTRNKRDREIVKTIIAMARNLNMDTVAEGVETQEQKEFLTQNGCHKLQGYYFGRPMPAEQFEEMLPYRNTVGLAG